MAPDQHHRGRCAARHMQCQCHLVRRTTGTYQTSVTRSCVHHRSGMSWAHTDQRQKTAQIGNIDSIVDGAKFEHTPTHFTQELLFHHRLPFGMLVMLCTCPHDVHIGCVYGHASGIQTGI